MQPLKRIARGIDTGPVAEALRCNEDLWHLDTSRQRNIHVQRHTQTIVLRAPDRSRVPAHAATEDVHPRRNAFAKSSEGNRQTRSEERRHGSHEPVRRGLRPWAAPGHPPPGLDAPKGTGMP